MTPFARALIAALDRPVIVQQADRFDLLRCRCPTCLTLDALYPGQGFQLALFPYRPSPLVRLPRMK